MNQDISLFDMLSELNGIGEMRTPISYYGGKQNMLKHILPLIPEHQLYVEPFFGGGAVFWAKQPSKAEIINDYNGNVVIFYDQLKRNFPALKKLVDATPYSREVYKQAMVIYHCPLHFQPVQRAWAFWMGTVQGFSHMIGTWRSSGADGRESRLNHNKKEAFDRSLSDRLKHTQIENMDAVELIKRHDSKDTFFYLDPPYVGTLMGHYGGYTQEHFDQLLEALSKVKGKFLLSSFPNEALSKCIKKYDWHTTARQMHKSASPINKIKKEVLTANFPLDKKSLNGLKNSKQNDMDSKKSKQKDHFPRLDPIGFELDLQVLNRYAVWPPEVKSAVLKMHDVLGSEKLWQRYNQNSHYQYVIDAQYEAISKFLKLKPKVTLIDKTQLKRLISQANKLKTKPDTYIINNAILVLRELSKSAWTWKHYLDDDDFKCLAHAHYHNLKFYLENKKSGLGEVDNADDEEDQNVFVPYPINIEKLREKLELLPPQSKNIADQRLRTVFSELKRLAANAVTQKKYENDPEFRQTMNALYDDLNKYLRSQAKKPATTKSPGSGQAKSNKPQKDNAMIKQSAFDRLVSRLEKINRPIPKNIAAARDLVQSYFDVAEVRLKYIENTPFKRKVDAAFQSLGKHIEKEEALNRSSAKKENERKRAEEKKQQQKQAEKDRAAAERKKKNEQKKATPKELKPTKYMLRDSAKVERISEELRFIKRFVLLDGKAKTESQIRSFINSLQRAITEKRIRKTSTYAKEIIAIQDHLIAEHSKFKGQQDSRVIHLPEALKTQMAPLVGKQEILKSVRVIKSYIGMQGRQVTSKRVDAFSKGIERSMRYGEITKRDPYLDEINSIRASVGEFLNSKKESGYLKIPSRVLNGLYGIAGVEDDDDWPQGGLDGINDEDIYESTDIVDMEFDTLGFTGKWYDLIGDPCRGFSMVIYARPKYGKSNLCLDFAGYLSRNHGRVLYVTGEEKVNQTFQDKLLQRKAAHPNLYATGALPSDFSDWDFVILDSLTRLRISAEELEYLKKRYYPTSFIAVLQVTKDGTARGSNQYIHNADSIVHLPEIGRAVQYGRFNQGGEIQIF